VSDAQEKRIRHGYKCKLIVIYAKVFLPASGDQLSGTCMLWAAGDLQGRYPTVKADEDCVFVSGDRRCVYRVTA
jgi:hypothetical protein